MATHALTRRNTTLADLAHTLRGHYDRSCATVQPARNLRMINGDLQIGEPTLTSDGVGPAPGLFRPTETCDGKIAEALKIPQQYMRRMRQQRHTKLLSSNVNTWLTDQPDKRYLIRTLRDANPHAGVACTMLSSKYKLNYNYEVLLSMLDGLRATGIDVDITQCDLTERFMYVKVAAPQVRALAPQLLRHYRSPFTGATGMDDPVVFAGFTFCNSETGHGAFKITPQLTVQVCDNGMTLTKDAFQEVHLGAELVDGPVRWSQDTRQAMIEVLNKQARDAVQTFLDTAFVEKKLAEIAEPAAVPVRDVESTLDDVGKQLRFTEDQQHTILDHFIRGADTTAGGVLHAVTSGAQLQPDADAAYDMERKGLPAMRIAAARQR